MTTTIGRPCTAGEYIHPLVVHKGKHLYERWTTGGPYRCTYAVTDSGWMSEEVVENWFHTPFVSAKRKPVVVFY